MSGWLMSQGSPRYDRAAGGPVCYFMLLVQPVIRVFTVRSAAMDSHRVLFLPRGRFSTLPAAGL